MAAERNPIRVLLPTFAISLFWNCVVGLQLLWKLVRIGPRQFFYTKPRDIRPQLLDDPSLGTHNFARLKQLKLHFVTLGPEDAPLMLFVHGFPEFWYSWRHQMREFSKKYRCVAFDMRGYSESDKPKGIHNYRMAELTTDLKELIPALGYEKCILVAHDWGGAVAWDFAWRNPEMVERLIVMNCPNSKAFAQHIAKSRSQFLKSWYMYAFQMPFLAEILLRLDDMRFLEDHYNSKRTGLRNTKLTDEETDAFKYSVGGDTTGPVNFYRASFQYKPQQPYPTERVPVRSLLIWGTEDAYLEREMAELSGRNCDDCTVKYIEGASHWVQQDNPQTVNTYMNEFLQKP